MRTLAPVFALLLPLAGCLGPAWQKDGADEGRLKQDLAECRSLARSATQRDADIDTDIMASRGHDWERTGVLTTKRDEMRTVTGGRAEDIVGRCMTAKGYSPG
jgi:hypothetical protein